VEERALHHTGEVSNTSQGSLECVHLVQGLNSLDYITNVVESTGFKGFIESRRYRS